ncbi:hypothetical protein DM684_13060 [Salmonella bongori]|nr:hypothetical protein [Salmonella bongori]ECE6548849.1 hypothetical protein [Salmonella bongori]ECI3518983.1 hypothetical protein [Salmonella bongori]
MSSPIHCSSFPFILQAAGALAFLAHPGHVVCLRSRGLRRRLPATRMILGNIEGEQLPGGEDSPCGWAVRR